MNSEVPIYFKCSVDPTKYAKKPPKHAISDVCRAIAKNDNQIITDIEGLGKHIAGGQSWSARFDGKGNKSLENFLSTQIIGMDIDNEEKKDVPYKKTDIRYFTIEKAIDLFEKAGININAYYHSFRSSEETEKFRLIILLDKPCTDVNLFKKVLTGLMRLCPALDENCKNADRLFFGSNNFTLLNKKPSCLSKILELCPPEPLKAPLPIKKTVENYTSDALQTTSEAIKFLYNTIFDRKTWRECGLSIASLGEQGREIFLNLSLNQSGYDDTPDYLNRAYDDLLNSWKPGGLTHKTIIEMAQKNGFINPTKIRNDNIQDIPEIVKPKKIEQDVFWKIEVKEKNNKTFESVRFDEAALHWWLFQTGFRKLPTSTANQPELIKIYDHIMEKIDPCNIVDIAKKFIMKPEYEAYQSMLLSEFIKLNQKMNNVYWRILETMLPAKLHDTIKSSLYSFSNCFVDITADNIIIKPNKDFKGYIFKQDIQNRNFSINDKKGEFEIFLENTQRDKNGNLDLDRLKSAISGIGYGLHKYHNQSNARALIIQDEAVRKYKTEANGGTGKSLIAKAIQVMRPGFYLDCKTADFKNDTFLYDGADPADQTLVYDDVRNNFPLETVYNQLQRPATINRKHKSKVPFNAVPKYIITSNSIIDMTAQSSKRRSFLMFCGEHYNLERTPFNDFSHNLFDDWDNDEWNLFYNFMFKSLQFYLKNGLIHFEPEAYKDRQIIELLGGYESYCWLKEYIFPTGGNEPNKLDSDNTLISYNSYVGEEIKKGALTKIIIKYCSIMKYTIDVKKLTATKRFYIIGF